MAARGRKDKTESAGEPQAAPPPPSGRAQNGGPAATAVRRWRDAPCRYPPGVHLSGTQQPRGGCFYCSN